MKIDKQVFMIKTKLNFFDQNLRTEFLSESLKLFKMFRLLSGLKTWGEAENF